MKKIGLLCLALVLALGALGVGYAAWTDTVTITGTVNTGTVDIEIIDYSNTWIWKVLPATNADEIVIDKFWDIGGDGRTPVGMTVPAGVVDAFPNPPPGTVGVDPVAYANSSAGKADDSIVIDIDNAFPLQALTADFLLHYAGTIPVKVTVSDLGFVDNTDTPIDTDIASYVTINYYDSDITGYKGTPIEVAIGDQWHYCDYILVEITVDLAQVDNLQGQSGTINGTITVKQWNEVP